MELYGLIGASLAHSWSQQFFTGKFKQDGLPDHRYDLFELEQVEQVHALVHDHPGIRGLNVTIPFKQSVMPLLDAIDPMAAVVGAVNTIAFHDGRLVGYNTDVEGFRSTLVPLLNGAKPRALVLGTGGASRAVVFVLKELGIKFRMVSRNRDRGDITWDVLDPTIVKYSPLIINATPVGMYPLVDEAPALPYTAIGPGHTLIDLVYNPEETRFLAEGRAKGATVCNGLRMLHAQAEASWRIWQNG